MTLYVLLYLVTALALLGIDAIWLSVTANLLYRPMLGDILLARFNLGAALAFYLIYTLGVVFFAVLPAVAAERWQTASMNGAMLGLVAYGTYDLTNQATLKAWSGTVTIADMGWGMVLTAVAATLGYFSASGLRAWFA